MSKIDQDGGSDSKGFTPSVKAGAVALVFLITGFQIAMFVQRAAVTQIVANRDCPDTVYVVKTEKEDVESVVSAGHDRAKKKASKKQAPEIVRDTIVRRARHSVEAQTVYRANSSKNVESFVFDPNTVSIDDLQRLGFSMKQAQSIVSYRMKGGRFRRKSDFAKSYVVSDSVYKRLEPYISIPLLDLNLADSSDFDALPGIGGYFASKMVEYRKRLGGSYSYKEQLMDIWKFDQEKYDALADLIKVSPENVIPYDFWTLPEDSLRLHPYIGKRAHGIVLYRENTPVSEWSLKGLSEAGVISESDCMRLSKCSLTVPSI